MMTCTAFHILSALTFGAVLLILFSLVDLYKQWRKGKEKNGR